MRHEEKVAAWVVYRKSLKGKPAEMHAVCTRAEWDAMELAQPGEQILVRADIANEGEAERFARGTAGDPKRRKS